MRLGRRWSAGELGSSSDRSPGRLPRTALSPEIVFVLLYTGVAVLFNLALRQWIVGLLAEGGATTVAVSQWWHSGEASVARWGLCGLSILVVMWLWVRYRAGDARHGWGWLCACVGAGVLVLLVEWALLATFEALPVYSVVRVFP